MNSIDEINDLQIAVNAGISALKKLHGEDDYCAKVLQDNIKALHNSTLLQEVMQNLIAWSKLHASKSHTENHIAWTDAKYRIAKITE